jgi:predicted nucleic acid-binding protein
VIVADTDVLIDFLRGHGPAAARVAFELEHGDLATTAVTRFELLAGARTERQHAAVSALLDALVTLPLDAEAADRAAATRRTLEERGAGTGMADCLIAGIALCRSAILLTRNRRHFERVPDLALAALEAG